MTSPRGWFADMPGRRLLAAAALVLLWSWLPRQQLVSAGRPLRKAGRWIWRSRWRRLIIRGIGVYHAIGVIILVVATPAQADDGGDSKGVPDNQVFSWMDVKDSHHISVWRYFMSLDHGNARSPWKAAYSFTIEIEYEIYRGIAASTIWLLTYILRFDWLQELTTPARNIGESLTAITGQLHLTGTLLTAAALVGGCWMLRGRWATGLYEIVVSCLIAVVAVGVLSNPVERVAGSDGLIMQSRDAGIELAAGITHRGSTTADPNEMLDQLSQSLADALIRRPTQALNFGQIIDDLPGAQGQKCIQGWDHGFDAVKGNTRDTLKDNIRNCEGGGDGLFDSNGGPMKAYADNPGPAQVAAAAALIIGAIVLMLFGWCLAFAVLAATVSAIYQALKAIPGLLFGIAPGTPRGSLWKTASHLVMALITIVFAIVFVAGYMLVIQNFFSASTGNLFKKIFTLDIVLVAGVVLFRRGVKAVRSYSDVLASKMAMRPGAAPTHIQRSTPHAGMLQSAYYTAQMGGQAIRTGTRAAHAISSYAAKQHAAAIGGAHAAAATAGTAATGGAAAATWAAWKVVQKAAGGAKVLNAAAGGREPQQSSAKAPRKQPSRTDDGGLPIFDHYASEIGRAAARRARRPTPDEVWKPGVKRRVGTAVPSAAATPKAHSAATGSSRITGGKLTWEQQQSSGLWVPAAPRQTATAPAATRTSRSGVTRGPADPQGTQQRTGRARPAPNSVRRASRTAPPRT